ncbi:chemotaxis protein MotB [Hypnocyclicus thermotrophus]|uniref:Chemotaxis protein MotB n=1 Tax=Hypnocyclicus thermotrophus TaxID=1627895 RepID=A0AA46DXM1_9FUSO|nr:flagellar motor protein MotB [Hypnocyclicus thermotrophus]TDT68553.1 chemotaxis protein MotB [Hypnocyclicus thermotrophus]
MAEKKCPPEGLPGWMGTYGDLVTLLLCFFVLLFAFSTVDSQKYKNLIMSFKGTMGVMKGGKTISPDELLTNSRIEYKGSEYRYQYLSKKIDGELKKYSGDEYTQNRNENSSESTENQNKENQTKQTKKNLGEITNEDTNVKVTERGIEISLGDRVLFDLGKAFLRKEAKPILDIVYNNIKDIENNIIIEGNTDNLPINNKEFKSNWELSTARAIAVLRYFISKNSNIEKRMSVAGYADTRPIATNDTKEGRQKNRRVVIVILKSLDERFQEKVASENPVVSDQGGN